MNPYHIMHARYAPHVTRQDAIVITSRELNKLSDGLLFVLE